MKSSFYKWHRILGLIALVPVICLSLSGVSHPFMSNWFRPSIPNEVYHPLTQKEMKPVLSIQQVMDKNRIAELRNFTLVSFNKQTFYQIMLRDSTCQYFSATDGKFYPYGDKMYAIYLARYFTQDTTADIKSVSLQTHFDSHYQPINRLLPVWKVSLSRPDGMDVYIETSQSRMGTFNNNTRKWMLVLFDQLHTWRFLATLGGEQFRIIVMIIIVSIMLLALISALTVYAFFWKRFKDIRQKRKADGTADKRILHRYHRQIGLWVSFVMFTFAVSGGFHLLVQLHNLKPAHPQFEQLISRNELVVSNLKLSVPDSVINKIPLVKVESFVYYQILNNKKQILYLNSQNGNLKPNGDVYFATYLSNFYYDYNPEHYAHGELNATQIRQFDNEYGFINKRLPVERVSYPNGENWYIETTTARLATHVAGIDRAEGLSFIFLHKYFGMTWAGKNVRDIVSMLAAFGVLVISIFGFLSFIKK